MCWTFFSGFHTKHPIESFQALEKSSLQKGCLTQGAEPSTPCSHPLGLPPRLRVFARQLRHGTLLPLTGCHLRSLGGLRAAKRPLNPGWGSSCSPMGRRRQNGDLDHSLGGTWRRILTVPQRRSGWAPGQAASGYVIGLCHLQAQVRELRKG